MNMKTDKMPSILYITVPSFFDLEISLLRELAKIVDLTVLMLVIPESRQSSALDISSISLETGVYEACKLEEMDKYRHLLPLEVLKMAFLSKNSFSEMKRLRPEITDVVSSRKYDLIHATSLSKFAIWLYPTFSGIKKRLLTLHDPIPHDKLPFLKRFMHELTIRRFKNVLLLNKNQTYAFMQRRHLTVPKIFYSRLGAYDFLNSFGNCKTPVKEGKKYILFFGRIEPYKGVDNMIRAFKKSDSLKKGYALVIAGKGKINEPHSESDGIICLNNYIPNEMLSSLIKGATFTVATYLSATQSGVIMSSYACGTPVLVTPVGNLPDATLSTDGSSLGHVCAGTDMKSVLEGIEFMTSHESEIDGYRKNIKKAFAPEGEMGWHRIALELKDIYSQII